MARRSWPRISLRFLFFLTTTIAIGVTFYLRQSRINAVVDDLIAIGAKVQYHDAMIPGTENWFGGFFADAEAIDLSHTIVENGDLRLIQNLARLQRLYLARTRISDKGIAAISRIESLRRLAIWGNSKVGDGSLNSLLKLKNLEVLDVHETRISPRSMRQLADMPSLKHLIFSADLTSGESTWLSGDDIQRLTRLRSTPVRDFYCREVTDKHLARMKLLDASRLSRMIIRDSTISGTGLQHLRDMKLRNLSIQSTPIEDQDLALIPWNDIDHFDFSNTNLTLLGIAEQLGEQCASLYLSNEMFSFYRKSGYHAPNRFVRFYATDMRVDAEALRKLSKLRSLSFSRHHYPSILRTLVELNPSVDLTIFLPDKLDDEDRFWPAIAQMDQLQGLILTNPPPDMRFTSNHQIRQLILKGKGVETGDQAMREIAKLEKLRFLWMVNERPLRSEVRHLVQLTNLRTLRIEGITDAGLSYVPQLSIGYLDINTSRFMTNKGYRYLEIQPFRVEIDDFNLFRGRGVQ